MSQRQAARAPFSGGGVAPEEMVARGEPETPRARVRERRILPHDETGAAGRCPETLPTGMSFIALLRGR